MRLAFVTTAAFLFLAKVVVVSSGDSYQFSDQSLPWMEAAISSLEGPFAAVAPASKLFDIAPAQDVSYLQIKFAFYKAKSQCFKISRSAVYLENGIMFPVNHSRHSLGIAGQRQQSPATVYQR